MSNRTFLGKVGMTPKGEWNSSTTYERLDVVSYEGSSYIALAQNVNSVPTDSNPNWMIGAKHGEFTEEQLEEFKEEVVRESKQEIDDYTDDKKDELDTYEGTKETELNTYTQTKKGDIDTHTTSKINDFNSNATAKTTAFNDNATSKTNTFNQNAEDKTTAFNTNATSKQDTFDFNATQKTTAFNDNATSKTTDFNDNAEDKTQDFDDNASDKTDDFDTHVQEKTEDFDEHADEILVDYEDYEALKRSRKYTVGTGESVTLNNTAEGVILRKLDISGNSKQDSYTGKNLLEPYFTTRTSNGVTVTLTNKGWKIDGTSSSTYSYFEICRKEFQAGTYVINGISGSGTSKYLLEVAINGTSQHYVTTSKQIITLSETSTISFRLYCYPGYGTFNGLILPYQLEIGTAPTDTYEPYVGGTPAPNPSYPQAITSSGDSGSINIKVTNGKVSTDADYAEQNFDLPYQQPMRSIGTTRDNFFKNVVGSEYYNAELDENAWYERHVIGQTELTAENVNMVSSLDITTYSVPYVLIQKSLLGWKTSWSNNVSLFNKYSEITATSQVKSGTFSTNFIQGSLNIFDDRFTNLATARELLIGTIIVIRQATPTYLKCTDAQVEVLEAIVKAKSYYEQTTVGSTDEVSPIYEVEAYQDENLIYDELNQAIVALGGV